MTQAHVPTDWHPTSWQSRHAAQQPAYRDRAHLESVLAQLEQAAADRDDVGSREPEVAARQGAARRGVPAARRRLRRELRRVHVGQRRAEAQDPAADVARDARGAQEADHSRRPNGGPVREAAQRRLRDEGRRVAAELPRRHDQPARVHGRRSRAGPDLDAARLRARGADAELRALADRRRVRGPAPPRELGSRVRRRVRARGRVPQARAVGVRLARVLRGHQRRADARDAPRRVLHVARGAASAVRAGADAVPRRIGSAGTT